ncbi:MAG: tyrosine-type recombinase/integrase [Acidobacteriaceae bacterium]
MVRHTFASRLAMAGIDLLTIGRLMGHRTLTQTARYAHLAPLQPYNVYAILKMELAPELTPAQKSASRTSPKVSSKSIYVIGLHEFWACSSTVRAGDS